MCSAAESTVPKRIVSVNICIDRLLWEMVPHENLVSLSYLTADPRWSPIANQLTGFRVNHGLAEEIIPIQPDVVLAGTFDNPDSMHLLQRLDVNVKYLPVPNVLGDLSEQVMQLGELVGAQPQASVMAEKIKKQLQHLEGMKQNRKPLTAFWYSSNGVVIGDGTLEHELMLLAGLRNLAAERGLYGFNPLNLELLLSAKPDVLIIEESTAETFSLAREYLSHPALHNTNFRIIRLPAGLSGCAASTVGEITEMLQQSLADHN